jgi:hypothetical protein
MKVRTNHTHALALVVCAAWLTGCEQGAVPAGEGAAKSDAKPQETAKPQPGVKEVAPVQPEARAPETVTLPVGTAIAATLQTAVASDKSHVGDPVTLRVTEPVRSAGVVVVPVGSIVHGTVTHVRSAGRVKGASEITIRFTEIQVAGASRYPVTCEAYRVVQKGDGRETAAEIGGGAAVGSVLGGVIGGKDDVLKGAAIGAAVGTGVAVATKGDQIVLPVGRAIAVRLTTPVVVGVTS